MSCQYCDEDDEDEDEVSASDFLDQTDLMEVAGHLARGDAKAASEALDYLFRADARAMEWLAAARNSRLPEYLSSQTRENLNV